MYKVWNEILQQSKSSFLSINPIADLISTQDCQIKDWKPTHKSECDIGKSIKQWKSFDWGKFDYIRSP
jgi:hypothetical protein